MRRNVRLSLFIQFGYAPSGSVIAKPNGLIIITLLCIVKAELPKQRVKCVEIL